MTEPATDGDDAAGEAVDGAAVDVLDALSAAMVRSDAQPDLDAVLRSLAWEAVTVLGAEGAAVLRRAERAPSHNRRITLEQQGRKAGHGDVCGAGCGMEVAASSDDHSRQVAEFAIALAHSPDEIKRINEIVVDDATGGTSRAAWSIPLAGPVVSYGTLEVYGARDTPRDRDTAAAFGRLASIVIAHAVDSHNLQQAVEARHHTGQAQGILMINYGLDTHAAFEVMRHYSQHFNIKLQVVASHIIEHGRVPDPVEPAYGHSRARARPAVVHDQTGPEDRRAQAQARADAERVSSETPDRWFSRDVAARTGLSYESVRTYRRLGKLPEPDGMVNGRPWWRPNTIRRWDRRSPLGRPRSAAPLADLAEDSQ